MRVGCQPLLKIGLTIFIAPHLTKAKEEALITTITINRRRWLATKRNAVGIKRNRDTGKIGYIFTQRQFTI